VNARVLQRSPFARPCIGVLACLATTTVVRADELALEETTPRAERRLEARAVIGSFATKYADVEAADHRGAVGGALALTAGSHGLRGDVASRHHGVRAGLGSRPLRARGARHRIGIGGGLWRAASAQLAPPVLDMELPAQPRGPAAPAGAHRYLDGYLDHAMRVIDALDVTTTFRIEQWSHLTTDPARGTPIEHMAAAPIASAPPELGASIDVRGRVGPTLDLAARLDRGLHAPSADERSCPARAGAQVFGRTRVAGLELAAAWRPTAAWRADLQVGAARTTPLVELSPDDAALAAAPRRRARLQVALDLPWLASVTGRARYLDRGDLGAYLLVDAHLARRITRTLSGFVAVDNVLGRRTGVEQPRLISAGVQVDSGGW
jgi:hypothetical protein